MSSSIDREFAEAVLRGLSSKPKWLHSKWFYDETGSRLFQRICEQPEYYLTRCEQEILVQHGSALARMLKSKGPLNVVELGPGDGKKTPSLLRQLRSAKLELSYIPIDISPSSIVKLTERLNRSFPQLEVKPLSGDFVSSLEQLQRFNDRRNLVLFLGSSIGNFRDEEARVFLKKLRMVLKAGDFLLLGFDLKKDPRILVPAYSDGAKFTAQFNLNLLARINRELGGNFQIRHFRHCAYFDPETGAMESYLLSTRRQSVLIRALDAKFQFEPWEPIHTECSRKYLPGEVSALAEATGYAIHTNFYDRREFFLDSLWQRLA